MSEHAPDCVSCEHYCPWKRQAGRLRVLGAPYCQTCDDHAEAAHAGYGDGPCGCGGTDCADDES